MNWTGLLSEAEYAFLDEVREFLTRELPAELRDAADRNISLFPSPEVSMPWQEVLRRRGWLANHWEEEFGGPGWTPIQRFVFETEAGLAGAPLLSPFGLNYLGPVLIRYGTRDQQQRFMPRILSGEDYWCQGYSEPSAGSDLANLKCAAVRDGDHYVVNGTKMWTTHAHHANWIFNLVRTDSSGRAHQGISFLLVDMQTPGVSVAPILSLTGDHEVNQVFFDDVRVPVENLVGAEGQGWEIAMYLLEFERGGFVMNGFLRRKFENCCRLAPEPASTADAAFLELLGHEIDIDLHALFAAEWQCALSFAERDNPGPEAMALKIQFTELMQRIESFGVAAVGAGGLEFPPTQGGLGATTPSAVTASYLNNRATTIYGGSSEIQRELIARNLVGI